jgi:hypothetical protein
MPAVAASFLDDAVPTSKFGSSLMIAMAAPSVSPTISGVGNGPANELNDSPLEKIRMNSKNRFLRFGMVAIPRNYYSVLQVDLFKYFLSGIFFLRAIKVNS